MSDGVSRDIRFLVTDPSGAFVLTRFGEEGALVLPGGPAESWSDDAAPFVAGARALLGDDVPILRIIPLDPDHEAATEWLVELEPTERSRRGHRWLPRDEVDPSVVDPPSARGPLARWLRELDEGRSPRRPPWSRPGWFERTSTSIIGRLRGAGYDPKPPTLHQLWGISTILRIETTTGRLYGKRSADVFGDEGRLTAALASIAPGLVPDVIFADGESGLFVMDDLGEATLETGSVDDLAAGLGTLATIQRVAGERLEALSAAGAAERGPTDVARFVSRLAPGDPALVGLSSEERQRFRAAIPAIVDACRQLEELAPLRSIVHGDLHPGNVTAAASGPQVFDWTDAAIGHPFVDLATYLIRVDEPADRRQIRDAYIESWAGLAAAHRVIEAADLALVVGAFFQVEAYQRLIAAFDVDDLWDLEGAAAGWLRQGLAYLDTGIEAPSVH